MRVKWYILGLIVLGQGIIVCALFQNPYPCTISGIGCRDVWEMLGDSWNQLYLTVSLFISVIIMMIGMEEKDEKAEKKSDIQQGKDMPPVSK